MNRGRGRPKFYKISTFSHNARTVAVASPDGVSEIRTGRTPERWELVRAYKYDTSMGRDSGVESMVFSQNGERLAVAYEADVVVMNTERSGRWSRARVIEYPCNVRSVAISPNAKLIMAGSGSGSGELWLWVSRLDCWVRRKRGGAPLIDV